MNKPIYNVLEGDKGVPFIQMVEPYCGVCFELGKVSFGGTDEEPVLEYTYNIVDGADNIDNLKEFESFTAELLLDMISERLTKNELMYTGGV